MFAEALQLLLASINRGLNLLPTTSTLTLESTQTNLHSAILLLVLLQFASIVVVPF